MLQNSNHDRFTELVKWLLNKVDTIKNEIIDPEYIGVEVSHMNIFGKYYLS